MFENIYIFDVEMGVLLKYFEIGLEDVKGSHTVSHLIHHETLDGVYVS
jgi:hypothetical protein